MDKPYTETVKEGKNKKAIHLSVLLALVALAFGLDQLLFGSFETASLKQLCGSAADLLVGCALAVLALQAYLWQSKKPSQKDQKGQKSRLERPDGKSEAFKAAQTQLNRDLDKASQNGEAKRLVTMLKKFEAEHGLPDALSYNLVLRAHAKNGSYKDAGEWILRMEEMGKATVCSYNTMLDAYAKAGKSRACETWLQRMLDKGQQPNVISFATVIHSFARHGDETSASRWQTKMLEMGVEPDTVSYNSLIHACGVKGNIQSAAGDLEKAEKWMEEMLKRGIEPNVVTFGAVINACAKASSEDRLQRAEFWHSKMLEMGVAPNLHTYSALINACAKAGKADEAEKWLLDLEGSGLQSDSIVYGSVMDACGKAGDCEKALAMFKRMRSRGIRAHVVTYSALARPFAYRGKWQQVEDIAVEMQKEGLKPNEFFIYAQLLAYATAKPKETQRAESCICEAIHAGVVPNQHIFGGLARAVGRKRATELLESLGHKIQSHKG
ncbi:unnamed protein product [Durusdinium trenchii]|uniref:Pentacotripeptide-repeat region of PRORP domain-containing protein n=1 Tax=Durusdinium trenchii TaxID=1381693 RepID=A0ABP0KRL9_9DINO